MQRISLTRLKEEYAIHRFNSNETVPPAVFNSTFYSISKTDEELSIVCDSTISIESNACDSGWSTIKILGPLDFSLTGILARISSVLAEARISIFAISTYDTDYILVKKDKVESAVSALKTAGYDFND